MSKIYRKTPIMGWASWNCFRTDISEEKMKRQADLLVETGLAECGYTYLNMDDGFFGGRAGNGELLFHKERFPNGIKPVADYAHSLGLSAGIYAEGGDRTCAYYYDDEGKNGDGVGLYGHEKQDLEKYLVECGFDFIKVDWCGGIRLALNDKDQYEKIAGIIDEIRDRTGKCIVFNICRWHFPGEWAVGIADSWRTGADITPDFKSILNQIDNVKPLRKFCLPGHVNDLDMMQIGNGLTPAEEKAHFIMWCMLSTPLMIGCDLEKIGNTALSLLKNSRLIAVNQDERCLQGYVVKEYIKNGELAGEVWYKPLSGENKAAVAFLNRSDKKMYMDFFELEDIIEIYDIFGKKTVEKLAVNVDPHGAEVFEIKRTGSEEPKDINDGLIPDSRWEWWRPKYINLKEAQRLRKNGAVLIDVRSEAEFGSSHIEGAINIPHTSIYREIEKYVPDKDTPVITYCCTGKRGTQAQLALEYLFYKNMYILIWDKDEGR